MNWGRGRGLPCGRPLTLRGSFLGIVRFAPLLLGGLTLLGALRHGEEEPRPADRNQAADDHFLHPFPGRVDRGPEGIQSDLLGLFRRIPDAVQAVLQLVLLWMVASVAFATLAPTVKTTEVFSCRLRGLAGDPYTSAW